jgi:hypothetical protein
LLTAYLWDKNSENMLNSLLERYQAYRLRRFLRHWTKRRAKGKSRYIIGFAFWWTIGIGGILTLGTYFMNEPMEITIVIVRFILLFAAGLLIGRRSWRSSETVFHQSEQFKTDIS